MKLLPLVTLLRHPLALNFVEVVKLVGGKVLVHVSKLNKDFLELYKRPCNNSSLRLLGAIATLPKLRLTQGRTTPMPGKHDEKTATIRMDSLRA